MDSKVLQLKEKGYEKIHEQPTELQTLKSGNNRSEGVV